MYSQELINIGQLPNDGTGDPLRVAYSKINNNFSNLFSTFVNSTTATTSGNTPGQVIATYAANVFSQGQFYINSVDDTTGNSQAILLSAHTNSTSTAVKFTGYGTSFFGDPISQYDMDVNNGNVRILVNPLTPDTITHTVSSQIMWANR